MSLFEQVQLEMTCDHPENEVRIKYDSLNRPQYFKQCLTCGAATTTAIKQSTIAGVAKVLTWDFTLEESWHNQKRQRYEALRRQQDNKRGEFWDRYNLYLKSPEWKMKRLKVLERDDYICQGCLENQATQVHHLNYDHVFNEPLFELTSVCDLCHNQITDLDSQRRNPTYDQSHAQTGVTIPQ